MSGVRVPPPASAVHGQIRAVEPKARGIAVGGPNPSEPPRTPYGLTKHSPEQSPGGEFQARRASGWNGELAQDEDPGVYVAHQKRCPALPRDGARCRCEPSWRGRRWNPRTMRWSGRSSSRRIATRSYPGSPPPGRPRRISGSWPQPVGHSRASATSGFTASVRAGSVVESAAASRTPPTTVADYTSAYRNFLSPEFGPMAADETGELEWQMWRPAQSRRALAVANLDAGSGRVGDLRLGDHAGPASERPAGCGSGAGVLVAVVGVPSLSDQLSANDLHRAPLLSGRCAAARACACLHVGRQRRERTRKREHPARPACIPPCRPAPAAGSIPPTTRFGGRRLGLRR